MAGSAAAPSPFILDHPVLHRLPLMVMAVDGSARPVFWNGQCACVTGRSLADVTADSGFLARWARPSDEGGERILQAMAQGGACPAAVTGTREVAAVEGPLRRTVWRRDRAQDSRGAPDSATADPDYFESGFSRL